MQFSRYLKGAVRKNTLLIRRQLTAGKRDFRKAISYQMNSTIDADCDPAVDIEFAELFGVAIDQLTPMELSVCTLFCEGLGWKAIGARVVMSFDAARMIHCRAEQRLRRWLDQK